MRFLQQEGLMCDRTDVRQSVREEAVVEIHTFNIFEKLSEKMKLKQVRANYWTDK